MGRSHISTVGVAVLFLFASLASCNGCHKRRPYTPYVLSDVPDAGVSPAPSGSGPQALDGGSTYAVIEASPASNDGHAFPLGDGMVDPPPGRVFTSALVVDANDDRVPDLIGWVQASPQGPGEVWFSSGIKPTEGRVVLLLPKNLVGTRCGIAPMLSQVGPSLVLVDLDPHRSTPRCSGASRWVAVLRFAKGLPPEVALELRLAPEAPSETLDVAVRASDRDGDGRADVVATFGLSGAPSPLPTGSSAALSVVFLDRPAGLSRDPDEPKTTLEAAAMALGADARRRATAEKVRGSAAVLRRLYSAICEEGGRPLLTTTAGPVRCGDGRFREDVTAAAIEAALSSRDLLTAFFELGQLDALGHHRRDVDSLVAKSVPNVSPVKVRQLDVLPIHDVASVTSPISWSANGDLLVQSRDRIVHVDGNSFEEAPAGETSVLPQAAATAEGASASTLRLASIEERCDEPTLVAVLSSASRTRRLPIPIPSRFNCATSSRVEAVFLGAGAKGSLIGARGDVFSLALEDPPRALPADALTRVPGISAELGAYRSPNGAFIAVPTVRGILVATAKDGSRSLSGRLWTLPSSDHWGCVPRDDGKRLACATPIGVILYDEKR